MNNNGKLTDERTKATEDATYKAAYTAEEYDIFVGVTETATCEETGRRSTVRYIKRPSGYNTITVIETISTEAGSLPALGHDFRPEVHWQTMTGSTYGYIQYTCTRCNTTVSDYLESNSAYLQAHQGDIAEWSPYKDNFVNGINYYYELFDTPSTIATNLFSSVVPTLQKDTEAYNNNLIYALPDFNLEGDAHQTYSWADGWRVDDWADGYLWENDATMDTNTEFDKEDCRDEAFYTKTESWMSLQVYFKPEFQIEEINGKTYLKEENGISYNSAISYYNAEVAECEAQTKKGEDGLSVHDKRMAKVNAQISKRIDKIDDRIRDIKNELNIATITNSKRRTLEAEQDKLETKRDSLEDKLNNAPKLSHYVARFGWYVVECEFYNVPQSQMSELIAKAIAVTNRSKTADPSKAQPSVIYSQGGAVIQEYDNR
jgi:hypothetical protein